MFTNVYIYVNIQNLKIERWYLIKGKNYRKKRGLKVMKEGIHPEYYDCTVICSCGNTFKTRSTKKELRVEICSNCHPFYTGKQKLVDSGGRVDRFQRRLKKSKKRL